VRNLKTLPTLCILLIGLAANSAFAQRIAVVDIQLAILNSTYGQAQLNTLNNDSAFADLIASVRSLQADIDGLDSEARTQASNWSNERFQQYTRTRQFKVADLQLATQKIQAERERVVGEIIDAMNDRALEALEAIINEEQITLLLRESAVYHAADAHNVTRALAERLSQ
jgi:outer membrane protein